MTWLLLSKPEIIKGAVKITELGISDHKLALATIWSKMKRPPPKTVRARTFKRFDQASFVMRLGQSVPCLMIRTIAIGRGHTYSHAPYREVKTRSVSEPWITPQIRKVVTFDLDKANILNEHFSTIGEKLANELPKTNLTQSNVHVSIVAACVISINLPSEGIVWLS